ncbi:hypothetical protein DFJ73DRAFT_485567, partial [Zopfochytrium polystomum]
MVAASGAAGTDPESLKNRIAAVNAKIGKEGQKTAAAVIAQLNKLKSHAGTVRKSASDAAFALEIEINDFPEPARWKVNNKKQISQIAEVCKVAITARGSFFPPGKQPGPGERKLVLVVEGDTQFCVDRAAKEIKLILKEATMMAVESEAPSRSFGRYLVTNG